MGRKRKWKIERHIFSFRIPMIVFMVNGIVWACDGFKGTFMQQVVPALRTGFIFAFAAIVTLTNMRLEKTTRSWFTVQSITFVTVSALYFLGFVKPLLIIFLLWGCAMVFYLILINIIGL